MTVWPLVRLSEVLKLDLDSVPIDPTIKYEMVGVYSFGRGLFRKEPVSGNKTSYRQFYRLRPGQIVMSQLFGWEGALAVCPAEFAGLFVSPQFPTFSPNRERLSGEFLGWYMRRPAFWEMLGSTAKGMGDRRRTLNSESLLCCEMPLPPLEEQRRIVTRLQTILDRVWMIGTLRQRVGEERQALVNAARRSVIGAEPTGEWIPLSHYVSEIENGWSPACENRPATDSEWGVLKLGAVSFGTFRPEKNKALPLSLQPLSAYEIEPGDFLMSRANTTELVGACVLVGETRSRLMLCDKIFRFGFRPDSPVNPQYLAHVLKSPALRSQIEKAATGTSTTMKNISKEKVLRLLVPRHSPAEQRGIVRTLGQIEGQQNRLTRLDSLVSGELDALPRSILNRAFSGQL